MDADIIKSIIAEYKSDFQRLDSEERYKWEAIKCFQDNWNPDAENFEEMLKAATAKAKNLLDSRSVFPRGMILEYAHNFPEETRQWFVALFDETAPLLDRIQKFVEMAEELNRKFFGDQADKKAHYQDQHAISVYLTFRYPEKYYFYKRRMFVSVAQCIGFDNVPKQGKIESLPAYFEMADQMRQTVIQDAELKKLSQSRLNNVCYQDENCTVLTQDLILFAHKNDPEQKEARHYWAGGCDWDGESKKEEFIASNSWRIGWDKDSEKKAAKEAWNNIKKVKPGDYFAFKGYGGRNDLVIYYVGEVTDVDAEQGYITLEPLEDISLYHGKGPSNPGGWFDTLKSVTSKVAIEAIFKTEKANEEKSETEVNMKNEKTVPFALNTIFYGPPGTGKTRILLDEIAKEYFYEQVGQLTEAERNANVVADLNWWEVVALCLLDNGGSAKVPKIMEHPLIAAHLRNSNNQSPAHAVWGQLQIHTKEDCENVKYDMTKRAEPKVFSKDKTSTWFVDRELLSEANPDLLKRLDLFHTKVGASEIKRYQFITFHQSYSYENFVEGISAETDDNGNIHYDIKPGIFWTFCQKALNDPDHKYALFIDEINRGNVSGVFGELISLIEGDKRAKLHITLPYSKKDFYVPKNLYIFGSMNTADRSIDALDSALRRRFAFVEMPPKPELLNSDKFKTKHISVDLCALLKALNRRVEFLLDRDHKIGHSYFMTIQAETAEEELANLQASFKNQIIPLLEDYFYGNLEKVQMVLGRKFIVPDEEQELTSACLMCGEDAVEFQDKISLKVADISTLTEADFAELIK